MRAPSVGFVLSAVKIRLFMWRTTVERPSLILADCEDPANPTDTTFGTAPTFSTRSPATESRSDSVR